MLSRRGLPRAAGGGAVLASAGVPLTGCGRSGGGPDGDLRVVLANHVWTTAVRKRIPEFSDLVKRRVLVSTMTADQLSSTYNVKLLGGASRTST
jgi:multiple sugar transport system substrate-binding protein